ncbi:MAG: TRAP transporter fused permease subunit, partial [Bacillota bacterium]|nr:TRAP transporter fused permease subunit [Bacillota bacterium]
MNPGPVKIFYWSEVKAMNHRKTILKEGSLLQRIVSIIAISMSLFHIYIALFGGLEALQQRGIFLMLSLVLVYLIYPMNKNATKRNIWLENIPFVILSVVSVGYLFLNYNEVTRRFEGLTPVKTIEIVLGILLILLIFEGARRVIGMILPTISIIFLLYGFLGNYIPIGLLRHSGYSLERMVEINYLTLNGIFGTPMGVASSFIILFIIFGTFLQVAGVDQLFMDIAQAITGKSNGGPAKVAVISSGLMGSISGSAVANVMTTGTITIPTIKRLGYKPHVAAAIEAVASVGGAYMPPVMGAVAFLMSEFTGIPYIMIVKHAVLPAVLYFTAIFIMVHLEAVKNNIGTLTDAELPDLKKSLSKKWHLLIPLV